MRGCVTAVLLSFLSIASAEAQCNYSAAYSGAFRSTYYDVAANPYEVWAATGYGVQLFSRRDAPATLAGSLALPGITRVIRTTPGIAYVGSGSSVYVVTNRQPPCQVTCPWYFDGLTVTGSVNTGATVNDIVLTPTSLYVATSNGLRQYDLLDPANPKLLATTGANVTGLSLSGSLLYAADGDNTVEIFDITVPALPQKTGSLQSLPRSTGVHATSTRVYVTDGQNTDVFIGTGGNATKVASVAFGTTSFAPLNGDTIFVAGLDRRVHAVDWSIASTPVDVFATDVVPSGGTVNRASAISLQGGALYLAAGDAGLQAYDVNGFTAPFAVRSYSTGAASSAAWSGGKLYVGRDAGGIAEFTRNSTGGLTAARQWDAKVHIVHDSNDPFLLTSAGSLLTYWFLSATSPTLASSAQFKVPVAQAVVVGSTAFALLDDGTLWSIDLAQQSPTPQSLGISGVAHLARSGNALATAAVQTTATDTVTTVSYFAAADFSKAPQKVVVPGAASGDLALSGSTAALFTFQGITVIDFATGTTTVVPQSNTAVPRALAFSGSQLLELTESSLEVWDLTTGKAIREFQLPAGGNAMAVDQFAAITNSAGVTGVVYSAAGSGPRLVATRSGNTYYKKIAASADRLYLYDGRTIDVFAATYGAAPHFMTSVNASGTVDFAVSSSAIFALSSSRVVTEYTRDGAVLAQATLNEGSDVQPLSIATANGAPWVAFSKGCISGACQKQTAVLDPRSLVRSALLDGAVTEVATSGKRAYATFDLPAEVRVYDASDALHPSLVAARPAEGTTPLVSIAQSNGTIYVVGDKLYAYDEALTKTAEPLGAFQPDSSYTYVDQRVRVDGGCGFVSGRSAFPQLFSIPAWSATTAPLPPASVRSVAATDGRLYLLTDDSVEVWLTQPAPPAPRRRALK